MPLPYQDSTLGVQERVEDLLGRMTLPEKVGQMLQLDARLDLGEIVLDKLAGSILHTSPEKLAEAAGLVARTRLKIPLITAEDCIHGHGFWPGATVFPTQLAMAATWDPALVERVGRVTAIEASATGVHWTFSPVLCITRDLRWGRVDETFGEDPYLISELGAAMIRGYQGDGLTDPTAILATAKHFAGYSETQGGRDASEADISRRKLRSWFLPPFQRAAEVGCRVFMLGYQSMDGVPITANRWLLNDVLKGEWGFTGTLVTDWDNVGRMVWEQKVCADHAEAAAVAVKAGNDLIMTTPAFFEGAQEAVRRGVLGEDEIDAAVRRILRLKFELGLFENPRTPDAERQKAVIGHPDHTALNLEVARRSLVLLRNDGTLPLVGTAKRIALLGPNADDVSAQLGDWAGDSGQVDWMPEGHPRSLTSTVLDGMRALRPDGWTIDFDPAPDHLHSSHPTGATRMTSNFPELPTAVIGAGPVGLAAAAHLTERGLPFVVLEAGDGPADAVRQWGHVRLFSPWRFNIDPAAARLLSDAGWIRPDDDRLPTGAQLAADYLQPLADLPALKPHIRYQARVAAVTRLGLDRVRSSGREQTPYLIRLADGQDILAGAIIDASGTWGTPNVLGASGIPAHGETTAARFVESALPDVLGRDRDRFAGRRTLVVGAGHSAANTLLALAELAEQAPGTSVDWAIRATSPARTYGGQAADALPARGALGSRLRDHVENGTITLHTGFSVQNLTVDGDAVTVSDGERLVTVDRIVSATGFRPDHAITGELRLDLDPILGSTRTLAPLIDPNEHSCGTVPPHGVDELSHPEPGYFAIGVKSYGRAPTFLLATGYEQARSVVAALAGDWNAARDVQLDLPETGVCNSNPVDGDDTIADGGGCCGAPAPEAVAAPAGRGLATGIAGGLLTAPLNLITLGDKPAEGQTGACC